MISAVTDPLLHLRVTGALLAVIAAAHLFVPAHLRWRDELRTLSLVNRQIFEVHTAFIVLLLVLLSTLLLTMADALLEATRLSRALLGGLAIFWGLRMLAQWFYYSPAIWHGDRFRTVMHYTFSAAWIYMTATFAAALLHTMRLGR